MMKRLAFLAALALAVGANTLSAAPLSVVTTTEDLASLTREVGGDRVTVTAIGRGYQDPHFIEAKPSFLLLLKKADLLEVVGVDLEISWLPSLLDQSRNAKIRPGTAGYLDLSQGVAILDRPTTAVNRSMGDVHAMGNPHYWLDPANAVRMSIQIRNRLVQLRPADTAYFDQRLNSFKQRINVANKRWLAAMAPYRGAKIVTYHNSWPNFARHFGLQVVDHIEPKPGVPAPPAHTLQLMQRVKRDKIKVVVMEPYFDTKTPKSVADRGGAKLVILYPSVGGKPGLDDYIKLFDYNIDALLKALK